METEWWISATLAVMVVLYQILMANNEMSSLSFINEFYGQKLWVKHRSDI